jgi:primosomal protein N' (replication factor Y)
VFRARSAAKSRSAAAAFTHSLEAAERGFGEVEVLGPVECPLSVIAGNHRNHLIFRSGNFRKLHGLVRQALALFQVPAGVYVEVDVDPVSLL